MQKQRMVVVRRPTSRLRRFLSRLTYGVIILLIVGAAFLIVQELFHPFDIVLDEAEVTLARLDRTLNQNLVSGVSLGTLMVILALVVVSIISKGVHTRQYMVSFWRGILSSGIFMISDAFYRYIRRIGFVYYSAALALFIALMLILVEIISRSGSAQDERETRTELLASIVSGLVFALLVQGGEALIHYLSRFLGA